MWKKIEILIFLKKFIVCEFVKSMIAKMIMVQESYIENRYMSRYLWNKNIDAHSYVVKIYNFDFISIFLSQNQTQTKMKTFEKKSD